jgi:hypothetical protein
MVISAGNLVDLSIVPMIKSIFDPDDDHGAGQVPRWSPQSSRRPRKRLSVGSRERLFSPWIKVTGGQDQHCPRTRQPSERRL